MSSPFAEPPPRRRLTIAHLMLWTLGCAIALAFYRSTILAVRPPNERITTSLQVFGLLYAIPAGARLGSVLLFGWMSCRGDKSFPTQPGHWLLVNEGASLILSWLGYSAVHLVYGMGNLDIDIASQIPNCVATAILYGVALRASSSESRLWKAIFWLLFLGHAFAALFFIAVAIPPLVSDRPMIDGMLAMEVLGAQYMCCPAALVILVPIVAIADPRISQRDFLHWTGVVASVAACTVSTVVRRFLF